MPDEYIEYDQVKNGANEILDCANKMQGIFDEVAGSVRVMTAEDNFKGMASDALKAEFEPFRAGFADYVSAVRRFANLYTSASESLETAEKDIAQKIEELGGSGN